METPTINALLRPAWQHFTQSTDYRRIVTGYGADQIEAVVALLGNALAGTSPRPLAQWHGLELSKGLARLDRFLASAVVDEEPVTIALEISVYFLLFACAKRHMTVPPDEVIAMFDERFAALAEATDEPALPGSLDIEEGAGMPAFHETTYRKLMQDAESWTDQFLATAAGQNTPLTPALCQLALVTLVEAVYKWHRKTPKTWTQQAFKATMITLYGCELPLEPAALTALTPLVADFLTFGGANGWLKAATAAGCCRAVAAAAPEMLEAAGDPTRWRENKRMLIAMGESGIAPDDEAGLRAFMLDYAEQQAVRAAWFQPGLTPSPLVFEPDARYLQLVHVTECDGRKWRKANATRLHNAAVAVAREIWSDSANAPLRRQVAQATAVLTVAAWYDGLYASALQTPKRWTVEAAAPVLAALQNQGDFAAGRLMLQALIQHLAAASVLTPEQAEALAALLGRAEGNAQSKVISLAAARAARVGG
ncbi:hypothetical protein [Lacticaseibacillus suihuaensis]